MRARSSAVLQPRLTLPRSLRASSVLALLGLALGLASSAPATEIQLTSVLYPERKSIDVPFRVTAAGPKAAAVAAQVNYRDGQARIEISYDEMVPALAFEGNITTYSVYAVTRDGVTENLGELAVSERKGSRKFSTGRKDFALMITAEPISGTPEPSTLVVLVSGPAKQPAARSAPFSFSRFGSDFYQSLVRPKNPSIANLTAFEPGAEPIQLTTAKKLVEMGQGMTLAPEGKKSLADAQIALAQAVNTYGGDGSRKVVVDYASRAGTLASEAIRLTIRKDYERMKAEEEARKAAEKAALQQGLDETTRQKAEVSAALEATAKQKAEIAAALEATAKQKEEVAATLDATSRQKAEIEAMLARVQAEKAAVEADRAKVKAERDELAERLSGALGKIMATRTTARGIAMDLGDVLFDVGKATLKPAAKESLAKLSGVLLMLPDLNVRVEGFTDSTGTAERNKILSAERARSVFDFLSGQAIAPKRMTHAGYGPANPVAGNDTKEGRAKNRRVELTFAPGTIEPTPGGFTAPPAPETPPKSKSPGKRAKPVAALAQPAKKG